MTDSVIMATADSTQPVLETCPSCGYSLAGLPMEHVCPECGFRFNRNSVVVFEYRGGYVMSALLTAIYVGYGLYLGITRDLGAGYAGFILMMLAILSFQIWNWRKPAKFVVISNKDIRFIARDRTEASIDLANVCKATWSRINGAVILWGEGDRRLHRISQRFLASAKRSRLAVAEINKRVQERPG